MIDAIDRVVKQSKKLTDRYPTHWTVSIFENDVVPERVELLDAHGKAFVVVRGGPDMKLQEEVQLAQLIVQAVNR